VIARFIVNAADQLEFVGKKNLYTSILGAPVVTSKAILFAVPNGDNARLRTVRHDELVIGPPAEMPVIVP
jgi:hypothetical protein